MFQSVFHFGQILADLHDARCSDAGQVVDALGALENEVTVFFRQTIIVKTQVMLFVIALSYFVIVLYYLGMSAPPGIDHSGLAEI
jgi:hypothetical protein